MDMRRLGVNALRHAGLIVGVAVVSSALAFGIVQARQADSGSTTLYACVNNASGTIHMVSADTACQANEQRVSWLSGTSGTSGGGVQILSKSYVLPAHTTCDAPDTSIDVPYDGFAISTPACTLDTLAVATQPVNISVLIQFGSEPLYIHNTVAANYINANWRSGTLALLMIQGAPSFSMDATITFSATLE